MADIAHNKMINTLINTKKKMKQLKAENEKLKAENIENIQNAFKCYYDKWKEEQESIVKEEYEEVFLKSEEKIEELKEENQKLKEEIDELNGCLEATTTERDKAFDDINKLKDATNQLNGENEKLKEK